MGNFDLVTEYNHWVFFLPVYTYLENCSFLATQKWGEGILAQGRTSQHKSPLNSMQSGVTFFIKYSTLELATNLLGVKLYVGWMRGTLVWDNSLLGKEMVDVETFCGK